MTERSDEQTIIKIKYNYCFSKILSFIIIQSYVFIEINKIFILNNCSVLIIFVINKK